MNVSKFFPACALALATLFLQADSNAGLPAKWGGAPSLAPMLEEVMPAVVNISTESEVIVKASPLYRDPFFRKFFDIPNIPNQRKRKKQGLGSGVILDANQGYVITNNHVIANFDVIRVTLSNGVTLDAKLVGADPLTDIAVIKIKSENLHELPLADSDELRVGDFVVAIGNPFGLGQTVTSGIVSALGRSGLGIEAYEDFIQTDASINPGNSGGALVNLDGELVGINTAILSPSRSSRDVGSVGIGLAIPINMAKIITKELIKYGEFKRGILGIFVQDLTPDLVKAFNLKNKTGTIITRVKPNTPAASIGLQPGDIIIQIDNKTINTGYELRHYLGFRKEGAEIKLKIIRNGAELALRATMEKPKN